jgi:hypothetical protein
MAQDDLTITGTTLTDDGEHLHLTVKAHNPSSRTRHLYNSFRVLRYDQATKTLEVQMSDHGLTEPRVLRHGDEKAANFILPSFTSVDPHGDAELSLNLPRTIVRPNMAKSTIRSMRFESLPIHESTAVKVDLAWADTPYYEDPRIPYDHRLQLVNWTKGVATHKSEHKPAATTGPVDRDRDGGKDKGGDKDRDKDKKRNKG